MCCQFRRREMTDESTVATATKVTTVPERKRFDHAGGGGRICNKTPAVLRIQKGIKKNARENTRESRECHEKGEKNEINNCVQNR